MAPSPRMQSVLSKKQVVCAGRQPPNLRALLFKPRFEPIVTQTETTDENSARSNGIKRCTTIGERRRGRPCGCCDLLDEGCYFRFAHSDLDFHIEYPFDCHTRNLIYCITCDGCGEQYIERPKDHYKKEPENIKMPLIVTIINSGSTNMCHCVGRGCSL